ncbi:copper resistance CopC family protein [Glycomyces arizonensis]|uniref:copper resistance CopC family protein n=1 Tax=Glycomyces arizonensis TaxID=256035 RepID=UPI000685F585|nr:copper resistance CopC family protein [Glycomyces arizonensis]
MLQRPRKYALKLLIAAGCGAILAAAAATAASAHAALVGTDPEDGATVATAPASVSATFSEILDAPSTEIAVTDPSGETLDVADPSFDGDTFTQPMVYTTPGEYTLAFRVVSEDGHRVDDAVTFTVETIPDELLAEGAEPEASDSPSAAATTAEASDPAQSEQEATTSPEEETNTGTTLAMILIAALVVVVGGVVLVKLLGRKNGDAKDS